MITQNYGQVPIAERTLDLFTAGVLAEQFVERCVLATLTFLRFLLGTLS